MLCNVCMYACMHVCIYACMHVCMYACTYGWMDGCMYVYVYVCMYLCMYVCTYVCMYVMYVCLSVCLSVCDVMWCHVMKCNVCMDAYYIRYIYMCVFVFHAQTPAKLCRMPWSLLPSCKRAISWAERLYAWISDSCDMFWDVCWSLWKQQNKGCILDSFWFMAALPARALTMTLHFMSSWVHKSCCYRLGMVDRPLGCNYVCKWNAVL